MKPKRRISITWLLIGGVGGLLTISLAITLGIGLYVAQQNTQALLRDNATQKLDLVAGEIERHLAPAGRLAEEIADWVVQDPTRLNAGDRDLLLAAVRAHPGTRGMAFMMEDGTRWAIERNGQEVRDRWDQIEEYQTYFDTLRDRKGLIWTPPICSRVLAAPLIAGQVPLHIDGEFRGIVGVARWPEPYVVFMEFGDNGLLFELRVFMTNVDNVLTVQSDLNFAIEAAYREAGIDMPFQQQEIHWQDIDKLTDAIRSIGKSGFLSA